MRAAKKKAGSGNSAVPNADSDHCFCPLLPVLPVGRDWCAGVDPAGGHLHPHLVGQVPVEALQEEQTEERLDSMFR